MTIRVIQCSDYVDQGGGAVNDTQGAMGSL